MKTLELLQDYAKTSNNLWLAKQLQVVEEEIKIEILEGECNLLRDLLKQ